MIRKFKTHDLDAVMQIWLNVNLEAHPFISESYWKDHYDMVKRMLPAADLFICEADNTIQGFAGLTDNYLAGIFVSSGSRSKGIGKALLDSVKEEHAELSLHVYKKNIRAVQFYKREDFIILNEQIDEDTDEIEFVMNWSKFKQ